MRKGPSLNVGALSLSFSSEQTVGPLPLRPGGEGDKKQRLCRSAAWPLAVVRGDHQVRSPGGAKGVGENV